MHAHRMNKNQARQFFLRVKGALENKLFRTTVPLFQGHISDPDKAVLLGTGVLISAYGKDWLVTAAHLRESGALLYIPVGDEEVSIPSGTALTHVGGSAKVDIEVIELAQASAASLRGIGQQFLDLTDTRNIRMDQLPLGGYAIYGYPKGAAGPDGSSPRPRYLGLSPFRGKAKKLSKYRVAEHGLLAFDRDRVVDSKTGKRVTFPDPRGMSGSSVWQTYELSKVARWDPSHAKLVGFHSLRYEKEGVAQFVPVSAFHEIARQRVEMSQRLPREESGETHIVRLASLTEHAESVLAAAGKSTDANVLAAVVAALGTHRKLPTDHHVSISVIGGLVNVTSEESSYIDDYQAVIWSALRGGDLLATVCQTLGV